MFRTFVLLIGCLLQRKLVTTEGHHGTNRHVFYAVEMHGGVRAARALAQQHGLEFIQRVGSLEHVFTLRDSRGRPDRVTWEKKLASTAGVHWMQRQHGRHRDKRLPVTSFSHSTSNGPQRRRPAAARQPGERGSGRFLTFNDPLWPMQWELFAQGQYSAGGIDLNVMPVWNNNITGNGVVVCIVDDGVDHTNKDLKRNFDAFASSDLLMLHGLSHDPMPARDEANSHGTRCAGEVAMEANNSYCGVGIAFNARIGGVDHTNKDLKRNFDAFASSDLLMLHGLSHDPMPARDEANSHGTRCAGEVAMEANNSYCGVGIAFNARIGGIRLLDGTVTDAMEASALTFNIHYIDIFVCSWGPRDDGAAMDGPHSLTQRALRLGTHKGRDGKGSIFVWAAGNGGLQHDHCGADGYVNSIYNIAIGAVTQTGKPTYFGEPCPGVMAVTLTGSGVGGSLPLITVTNLGDGCVTRFPGTSSAAPIAAGILALALEVNPELTWRDVQHLIANTAKIPDPKEPGWTINAGGYHVHHRYGFGLLDAGLMVRQAARFNTVAPQRKCTQKVTLRPPRALPSGGVVNVNIQSDACYGSANEINTLEHVQVRVRINAVCRGDLSISLESPASTVSLLLDTRPNDASSAGLKNWTLMTVHCWGERPQGLWTLQVTDHRGAVRSCVRTDEEEAAGVLLSVTLVLYGTRQAHGNAHGGPLQSIVSMGSRHQIPQRGVYQRDRYPPQDLIQWIFRMERAMKVQTADITIPARSEMLKSPKRVDECPVTRPGLGSSPAVVMERDGTETIMDDGDETSRSLRSPTP